MDRLTEMEAFATVVDQGGFTDAARKLGISKSAVSKHVSALEARLGARLLTRTTRRVSPTEIGLAYYDRARRVLDDAGEADAMVSSMQASPAGMLRISVARDFGMTHIAPLLPRFLETYPDICINMDLGNRHAELVSEGYDMAIRVGEVDDGSLRMRKLAETSLRLVASPGYLQRHGRPQRIEDLNAHKLLHHDGQGPGAAWRLTSATGERRYVRTAGWLVINDSRALLDACAAGLGIAYLPSYVHSGALARGLIEPVIPDLPIETRTIHAVHPPGRITLPKVRALIDFLAETFDGCGPDAWPMDRAA